MRRRLGVALVASLLLAAWQTWRTGQGGFRDSDIFRIDELAARRARMMDRIGDAVAVVQGTTERPGEQALRQNTQFFYLTGVVEPRAIVLIDGRTKQTTLFLQPLNERREGRMYGPGLQIGRASCRER